MNRHRIFLFTLIAHTLAATSLLAVPPSGHFVIALAFAGRQRQERSVFAKVGSAAQGLLGNAAGGMQRLLDSPTTRRTATAGALLSTVGMGYLLWQHWQEGSNGPESDSKDAPQSPRSHSSSSSAGARRNPWEEIAQGALDDRSAQEQELGAIQACAALDDKARAVVQRINQLQKLDPATLNEAELAMLCPALYNIFLQMLTIDDNTFENRANYVQNKFEQLVAIYHKFIATKNWRTSDAYYPLHAALRGHILEPTNATCQTNTAGIRTNSTINPLC